MKTSIVEKGPMTFVGIAVRTTNSNETSPETSKIGALWERFTKENLFGKIENKANEHFVYGLYYDYETNENGAYSVLAGTVVTGTSAVPDDMVTKEVPASKYLVFSSEVGPMPDIVIQSWQHIWQYFKDHPEHQRTYTGDFELYDLTKGTQETRSVDFYIAIK